LRFRAGLHTFVHMLKRLSLATAGLLFIGYAAIAGYLAAGQDSMIFRVDPERPSLAAAGLPRASEVSLAAADGVTLSGWEVAPASASAPIYVYFHGNARTHARRAPRYRLLTEHGAGLVAFHYRGYGGSGGAPSEEALHRDAQTIYDDVRRRYPGHDIILFGESLGTGVATHLASRRPASALILDSPFSSVLNLASDSYPWLPVGLLLRHHFRSDLAIRSVRMPVLILHGERDRLIPVKEAERLLAEAAEPKRLIRYPRAGHVAVFSHGAIDDVRAFLRDIAGIRA